MQDEIRKIQQEMRAQLAYYRGEGAYVEHMVTPELSIDINSGDTITFSLDTYGTHTTRLCNMWLEVIKMPELRMDWGEYLTDCLGLQQVTTVCYELAPRGTGIEGKSLLTFKVHATCRHQGEIRYEYHRGQN